MSEITWISLLSFFRYGETILLFLNNLLYPYPFFIFFYFQFGDNFF